MKVGTDGVLLGAWTNPANAFNILDIGTGTGLIALMLAQKSRANIDAIEIDSDAYDQALENVRQSVWKERISVMHNSLQDFARSTDTKYDLVVTNPPFFTNSLKSAQEKRNLARHNDTLTTEDLLAGVDRLLKPLGSFCAILPYVESQLLIVDAALYNLYCMRKTNVLPLAHKKPTRVMMEFSRNRSKVTENELVIQHQSGEYTNDYKLLTNEFYLNF
jgi:tRNA1Val (adenine37-N6)-methyltransferase